jgi:hypothetical protein
MRKIFIDVDAFSKCAHWEILDELPDLLQFKWDQSSTLESLKCRANKSKKTPDGKLFHTSKAAALASDTIAKMQPISIQNTAVLSELVDVHGIDGGEILLFSAVSLQEEAFVLTGDKRALRALAKVPATRNIKLMHGKFICIEILVHELLKKFGLEWIRSRICPHKDLDKSIANILGSNCDADENSVLDGLHSYIKDLNRDCSEFLVDF